MVKDGGNMKFTQAVDHRKKLSVPIYLTRRHQCKAAGSGLFSSSTFIEPEKKLKKLLSRVSRFLFRFWFKETRSHVVFWFL